jgi:hypothetical protein
VKREEIIAEIRETRKDLAALVKARDILNRRIVEQEGSARHDEFYRWPLMQALLNIFISATVRCTGLIEDYEELLESTDVPDNVFKLERP